MSKHQKPLAGETQFVLSDLKTSPDSLELQLRTGVSSNLMTITKISPDEVQLDFLKITVSDGTPQKDLVSRITLSVGNAKALQKLLEDNL